jgi:hypothetical protein
MLDKTANKTKTAKTAKRTNTLCKFLSVLSLLPVCYITAWEKVINYPDSMGLD